MTSEDDGVWWEANVTAVSGWKSIGPVYARSISGTSHHTPSSSLHTKEHMNITHPIKVKVYWNLHKKCFSVQHKGLVIAHVNQMVLTSPTFKVSEAGRQRVLATRRKTVHAFVVGMWDGTTPDRLPLLDHWHKVTYNPYKYSGFVYASNEMYVDDVRMQAPTDVVLFKRDDRANIFVFIPS